MIQERDVNKKLVTTGTILVVLNAIIYFIKGATGIAWLGPASVVLITLFSFTHGVHRYGLKNMLYFFGMITIVSWSYETISVLTGFPFGNYHYTDVLGPKLWLVPIVIMPAYFSTGYLSWVITTSLFNKDNASISKREILTLPIIASFIMVFWDLPMDPVNATITKMWIWTNGGEYFGIPFVNFLGWYLCVFTFYIIFAKRLSSKTTTTKQLYWNNKQYWVLPILMYLSIAAEYLGGALFAKARVVTSNTGQEFLTTDIYFSSTLIALFTMVFISVLALFNLYNRPNQK